jgi:hypothetical protein
MPGGADQSDGGPDLHGQGGVVETKPERATHAHVDAPRMGQEEAL